MCLHVTVGDRKVCRALIIKQVEVSLQQQPQGYFYHRKSHSVPGSGGLPVCRCCFFPVGKAMKTIWLSANSSHSSVFNHPQKQAALEDSFNILVFATGAALKSEDKHSVKVFTLLETSEVTTDKCIFLSEYVFESTGCLKVFLCGMKCGEGNITLNIRLSQGELWCVCWACDHTNSLMLSR